MASAAGSLLSNSMNRLQGKVAIVTGSGIGEATARLFKKHGAKVIIADIKNDLGRSVCNDVNSPTTTFFHCDVTNESDVENVVNTATAKYGKLDIMHNNAGIIEEAQPNVCFNSLTEFQRVINVNLVGVFLGTKHAARVMVPNRWGSIIATASVSSVIGGCASHANVASKHAVAGLTKNAAVELGQHGIRFNCVPSYVLSTPISTDIHKLDGNAALQVYSNLKGTTHEVNDVAEAILYLASDESKYVSGHNLVVDGGFTIVNPMFTMFPQAL